MAAPAPTAEAVPVEEATPAALSPVKPNADDNSARLAELESAIKDLEKQVEDKAELIEKCI